MKDYRVDVTDLLAAFQVICPARGATRRSRSSDCRGIDRNLDEAMYISRKSWQRHPLGLGAVYECLRGVTDSIRWWVPSRRCIAERTSLWPLQILLVEITSIQRSVGYSNRTLHLPSASHELVMPGLSTHKRRGIPLSSCLLGSDKQISRWTALVR
jgi:hypothetical protein